MNAMSQGESAEVNVCHTSWRWWPHPRIRWCPWRGRSSPWGWPRRVSWRPAGDTATAAARPRPALPRTPPVVVMYESTSRDFQKWHPFIHIQRPQPFSLCPWGWQHDNIWCCPRANITLAGQRNKATPTLKLVSAMNINCKIAPEVHIKVINLRLGWAGLGWARARKLWI